MKVLPIISFLEQKRPCTDLLLHGDLPSRSPSWVIWHTWSGMRNRSFMIISFVHWTIHSVCNNQCRCNRDNVCSKISRRLIEPISTDVNEKFIRKWQSHVTVRYDWIIVLIISCSIYLCHIKASCSQTSCGAFEFWSQLLAVTAPKITIGNVTLTNLHLTNLREWRQTYVT